LYLSGSVDIKGSTLRLQKSKINREKVISYELTMTIIMLYQNENEQNTPIINK